MSTLLSAGLFGGALALWIAPFGMPLKTPVGKVLHGLSLAGSLACAVGLTAASHRQIDREDARRVAKGLQSDLWAESMALWAVSEQDRLHRQFIQPAPHLPAIPVPHHAIAPSVPDEDSLLTGLELASLEDANRAVHTGIVGPTDSGKSTVAMHLASQLKGEVQVYDSDAAPHEWKGLPVIGRCGNFEAIARAMANDLEILKQRTELRGKGHDVGTEVVRVCEEFPTVAAEIGDLAIEWLEKLLRRGRKYRIKVILVSQQKSVKALRLEGQGDLRDCLNFLYLGKTAIAHAKTLTNRDELLQFLGTQQRPAMLENLPVVIPDLTHLSAMPTSQQAIALPPVLPPQQNPWANSVQFLNHCLDIPEPMNQPETKASGDPVQPEPRFTFLDLTAQDARDRITELRAVGLNQTQIIEFFWRVKKGGSRAYIDALAEYKHLMDRA
jgi:hypothetical protein